MTNEQYITIEFDIAKYSHSSATSFEGYASEGMGDNFEGIDFDASAAAYAASIAREYEKLAGLPEGTVTVELSYNWPNPLEGDDYDAEKLEAAIEAAYNKQEFWREEEAE